MREKIGVVACFLDGGLKPLIFRWGRRNLKVEAVTYRWESRCGQEKIYHFSAVSQACLYHLSFYSSSLTWMLEEVQDQ